MSAGTAETVGRSAIVLYGTETGNSYDVAYELGQILERLHFVTDTEELDNVNLARLRRYALVCIVLSTTGQGDFPSNARRFWLSSLRKKLSPETLDGVIYGMVGLCDSSYPKFNFAARKLDKRLRQLGARCLLQPCEADEQGEEGTEGALLAWLPSFKDACLHSFPMLPGQEPIPDEVRLPSRWTLALSAASTNKQALSTPTEAEKPFPFNSLLSSESTFDVELQKNERVTPSHHWQDVRYLQLSSQRPIHYLAGDAIAIRPQNSENDVNQLIGCLRWNSVADEKLVIEDHRPQTSEVNGSSPVLTSRGTITLRQLLTSHLDILSIPKRSFFTAIAHFTKDEMQKERAIEFTDPQYLDEYFNYATRPRRSILEVLQEFDTVEIPWQEALSVFPVLRPRQFSIASGGAQKRGGKSIELLVAIVRYRTVIKRIRQGVCTKYLAGLLPGSKLNVTLHTEGRFKEQTTELQAQRHLLIGAGTGVAPLRAIINEKAHSEKRSSPTILFFGCRNGNADFFFQDEWLQLITSNGVQNIDDFRLITAFSRDQEEKVYVQDKIRQYGRLVKEWLYADNTGIVVCGSSGNMPKAVKRALKDVLVSKFEIGDVCLSENGAEEFLSKLEKSGRYKQETW